MKQASGELNTTIIVILAVGVLIAFFYFTIWPIIKTNLTKSSNCSKAICEKCQSKSGKCKYVKCHLSGSVEEFECVYKG